LGWLLIPCWSKVKRTSIVAIGGPHSPSSPFPLRGCLRPAHDIASASSGAKADARRVQISFADHVAVMLSGNCDGLSTTKTSDSLRKPRRTALFWSSFLRMSPRPSASPGFLRQYIWFVMAIATNPNEIEQASNNQTGSHTTTQA
jgi:hypothetical protein